MVDRTYSTCFVYVLSDPRTNQIRYVGKTEKSLKERLDKHLQNANLRPKSHKNMWLKNLSKCGLRPEIDVVEVVASERLDEAEKFWIEYFRFVGADLVNHTDGGAGATGYRHTLESKAKISAAHRGCVRTEEYRTKQSKSHGGRTFVDQYGRRYLTLGDAVRRLGADASAVSRVLHGKVRHHQGLVFKYEEVSC